MFLWCVKEYGIYENQDLATHHLHVFRFRYILMQKLYVKDTY